MQVFKTTFFALVVAIAATACSKSNSSDKPFESIAGVWKGTVITDHDKKVYFWSFGFRANGVLEVLNQTGGVVATGTWSLENNILMASYTQDDDKFSIIGSHNASLGKILGNWGYDNSTTDGGTWEMSKQ